MTDSPSAARGRYLQEEAELRQAEQMRSRLAAIVESSQDAILGKTLDGTITSWNAAAERLFGYAAQEIIGRPITQLLPQDCVEEEAQLLARIRRGERVEGYETTRLHRSGEPLQVLVTLSPIRDGSGRLMGISSVIHDIRERKRSERALQESEARYRSLVEASGAMVFRADAEANWIEPQPDWESYTGQSFERYRGHGWIEMVHPDDRRRIRALLMQGAERGTTRQVEGRVWHAPTRSWRWQEARAVAIRGDDGQVREWVGTVLDIHARKTAEHSVREADRRKDEFLATLAHELRNPLAPICSGMQILRLASSEAARSSALDIMDRQIRHLVRLVDDLMEVSRITRGAIELRREPLVLQEVLQAAVEISRELIEGQRHRLALSLPETPLMVHADRVRVTQIVANLLNNAAKYTPAGGSMSVSAEPLQGHAVVRVTDSGMGIAPELIGHIFDMFVQSSQSRFTGGLGIGLALARRLAELHGGTLEASSAGEGLGSEFTLQLPLCAETPPPASQAHVLPAPARRVLVVDDNRDAAATITQLLLALGHDARAVHDGRAALAASAEFRPQVVLLDVGMAGMDGFEVARSLRREPWAGGLRIVAVTGWGQDSDRQRSREAGFDLHLVKPVGIDDLQHALRGGA